jgi:hypothetical protein
MPWLGLFNKITNADELIILDHVTNNPKSAEFWCRRVKMLIGGVSTSGIKSILKINSEIIDSCKKNRIYTNFILIYSKYLFKWFSFFKLNRNEY